MSALALLTFVLVGCGGAGTLRRRVHGEVRSVPAYSGLAYEHFLRAELLHDAGDLPQAADAYRLAIVRGANDVMVWARYAEVLAALGDLRGATAALAVGHDLDPESATLWRVRADVALARAARADDPARAEIDRVYARRSLLRAYVRAPLGERLPLLERAEVADVPHAVFARLVAETQGEGPTLRARRAALEDAHVRRDARAVEDAARAILAVAPRADEELADQAWRWLDHEPGVAAGIARALMREPSADRAQLAFAVALRLGRYDEARGLLRSELSGRSRSVAATLALALWARTGANGDLDEAARHLQLARESGAPLVALEAALALARGEGDTARRRLRAVSPEESSAFGDAASLGRLLGARGLGSLATELPAVGETRSGAITRAIARPD